MSRGRPRNRYSVFCRSRRLQASFANCRHPRLIFPGLDGLHIKRSGADTHCALDCSGVQPETVLRSGSADLLRADDHLHIRNLDSVLPELNSYARPST